MYNLDFEDNKKWGSVLEVTVAVWKVSDASMSDNFLKEELKKTAKNILIFYTYYFSSSNFENKKLENKLIYYLDKMIALLSLSQRLSKLKEINFVILKNEYKKIKFELLAKIDQRNIQNKNNSKKSTLDESQGLETSQDLEENKVTEKKKEEEEFKKQQQEESEQKEQNSAIKKTKTIKNKTYDLSPRQQDIIDLLKRNPDAKIRPKDIAMSFPKVTPRTIRTDLKILCDKNILKRSSRKGQSVFYYLVK